MLSINIGLLKVSQMAHIFRPTLYCQILTPLLILNIITLLILTIYLFAQDIFDGPDAALAATQQVFAVYVISESSSMTMLDASM